MVRTSAITYSLIVSTHFRMWTTLTSIVGLPVERTILVTASILNATGVRGIL